MGPTCPDDIAHRITTGLDHPMAHYSTAEQSRQRAARCLQLAEETSLPKLKKVFLTEADGWLRLAEEQERSESRTIHGPRRRPFN